MTPDQDLPRGSRRGLSGAYSGSPDLKATRLKDIPVSDGAQIRTLTRGASGFPNDTNVVFLHGNPNFGDGAFVPQARYLAPTEHIRVILPTRRGYGESTGLPDDITQHRTFSDSARDTAEVLDHLGVNSYYLVARSGGGPHALKLAEEDERVKGVTLFACALPKVMMGETWSQGLDKDNASIDGMTQAELYDHIGDQARLIWLQKEHTRQNEQLLAYFPTSLTPEERWDIDHHVDLNIGEQLLQSSYERAVSHGFEGWYHDAWALFHEWPINFDRVTQPVRLIYYKNDRFAPPHFGEELQSRLPNSTLVVRDGTHFRAFGDLKGELYDIRRMDQIPS